MRTGLPPMANSSSAVSDNHFWTSEVVMIEVYAFLAAFAVLVPAVSVLIPLGYLSSIRTWTKKVPTDRFANLGIDFDRDQARYLRRYRVMNVVIALLGLLLLGWLASYMQGGGRNWGLVNLLVTGYFVLFVPPMLHVYLFQARQFKTLFAAFPERKRKATLQRRGLFDFVSPIAVFLAIVVYFLFAAFVLYLRHHPFVGFGGLANLVIVTLQYALIAFLIHSKLYGKKNPIESPDDRTHSQGVVLNLYVYMTLAIVIGVSMNLVIAMLELRQWAPFLQTVGYVIYALVTFKVISTRPRDPDANAFPSDESVGTGTLTASADPP